MLTIPNQLKLAKDDPKLGEALQAVEQYVNTNVTPVTGNKKAPPSFLDATKRPG